MRYSPDIKNQVRRAYLLKSPCQPHSHKFLQRIDKNRNRRFIFDEFGSLLEYSIAKDAAYCLYCYLFYLGRKKERLREHVGDHNSDHNRCRLLFQDLMNQAQHIEESILK
ncbi:hypothetical protein MANES_04G063963v8 [Manihot esculenta]|uniref:Uncharacterized protein n=1 Tax=Manihot esculenta TaxID=3983 RepID=A0ACB7HSH3_MANES|nr:hypothetical protein MANES_04G063963v8 [Manihot esculenta]